jgi:hypothetical protein
MCVELHIIFTDRATILSKKQYSNWQAIQSDYDDYKASLGPWDSAEVVKYLVFDYPNLDPTAAKQVADFLGAGAEVLELTFAS